MKPGTTVLSFSWIIFVVFPISCRISALVPTLTILSPLTATASAIGWEEFMVRMFPPIKTKSADVKTSPFTAVYDTYVWLKFLHGKKSYFLARLKKMKPKNANATAKAMTAIEITARGMLLSEVSVTCIITFSL